MNICFCDSKVFNCSNTHSGSPFVDHCPSTTRPLRDHCMKKSPFVWKIGARMYSEVQPSDRPKCDSTTVRAPSSPRTASSVHAGRACVMAGMIALWTSSWWNMVLKKNHIASFQLLSWAAKVAVQSRLSAFQTAKNKRTIHDSERQLEIHRTTTIVFLFSSNN